MTERKINYPQADIPDIRRVVTVAEGGFGGSNLRESAAALGVLVESEKGQTIVSTADLSDSNLKITGPDFSKPILKGPSYVVAGFPYRYDLVNPLMTGNVVTVDRGAAAFVGATVTGTAPSEPGVLVMTVNGREVHIPVKAPKPMAPILSCVSDGKVTSSYYLPVAVSPITTIGYNDTLKEVEYQISEIQNFERVLSRVEDTSKATEALLELSERGKTLYIRARLRGAMGEKSDWSNTVKVTVDTKIVASRKIAEVPLIYPYSSISECGPNDFILQRNASYPSGDVLISQLFPTKVGKLDVVEHSFKISGVSYGFMVYGGSHKNYGLCYWKANDGSTNSELFGGVLDIRKSSANYGKVISSWSFGSTSNNSAKTAFSLSGKTAISEIYRSEQGNGIISVFSADPESGVATRVNIITGDDLRAKFGADRNIWSHYLRPDGLLFVVFLNAHSTNNGTAVFFDRSSESEAFTMRNEVSLGRMTDYPQGHCLSDDGNTFYLHYMKAFSAVSDSGGTVWKITKSGNVYGVMMIDSVSAGNFANHTYPTVAQFRFIRVVDNRSPKYGKIYEGTSSGLREVSQTEADILTPKTLTGFEKNRKVLYKLSDEYPQRTSVGILI